MRFEFAMPYKLTLPLLFLVAPAMFAATSTKPTTVHPPKTVERPRTAAYFIKNEGQAAPDVLWQANGASFEATFGRDNFVFRIFGSQPSAKPKALAGAAVASGGIASDPRDRVQRAITEQRISLAGANPRYIIEPLDPQPGTVNFFRGNDPKRWVHGLATYARLRYKNIYPGIDLLFYPNHGTLEYDFVVSAGSDPGLIRLKVEDDSPSRITEDGELQVGEGAQAVLHRPMLYQNRTGGKRAIEGRFVSLADGAIGFKFGAYDRTQTLVIDPTLNLLYSTYLGGHGPDVGNGIALDAQNNSYIVGQSASADYPVSGNAYQPGRNGLQYNAVVTKISPSGTLLYSTYFSGTGGDIANGVGVDAQGNAYVTGVTSSMDFPVTANGYQRTYPGGTSSVFLTEVSADGSALLYSTYLGGSGGGTGYGVAVRSASSVYVTGTAGTGLPTSADAYLKQISSGTAAFVAIFNPAASGAAQLLASTYYGVANPIANDSVTGNIAYSMALDGSGKPWIVGQTWTNNLPTSAGALQPSLPAISATCQTAGAPLNSAAFVASFSADLATLAYASYLSGQTVGRQVGGACSEYAHGVALDSGGDVYVGGITASSTFPVTAGVPQGTYPGGGYVGFVTKLSPAGALTWSSYLGGNGGSSYLTDVALDSQANMWVSGTTYGGTNFPISQGAYQSTALGEDAFITEFSTTGTQIPYSTYLGGSGSDIANALAVDAQGNVYATGGTSSTDFPLTANAFQSKFANGDADPVGDDVFFTILGGGAVGAISPATGGNTGDTTITISGAGFQAGASCSLVQGSTTIQSTAASVATGGTSMTCTFSLNGAATGSYNVIVNNPGSTSLTEANAFTVTGGGSPQIWTNVVGRSKIRTGVPSTFTVTVGNSGTSDAYFTVLWILFPSTLTYTLNQPLIDPTTQLDYSQANSAEDSSGNTVMKYIFPHLPPGSSLSIGLALTAATDTASIAVESYTYRPWYDSYSAASADLTAAQNGGALSTTCTPNPSKSYLNDCLGPEVTEVSQDVLTRIEADPSFTGNPSQLLATLETEYAGELLSALNETVAGAAPDSEPRLTRIRPRNLILAGVVLTGIGSFAALVALYLQYEANQGNANRFKNCKFASTVIKPCCHGAATVDLILNCPGQSPVDLGNFTVPCDKKGNPKIPQPCGGKGSKQSPALLAFARLDSMFHTLGSPVSPHDGESCSADDSDDEGGASGDGASCSSSGGSVDPNDKNGPVGDGSASQYVRLSPLTYNVAFENEATATLPASQVVVTDQLDPTKVDLSTVTLGSISFGTNIINLPSGTNNYTTTSSINSSLSVRIQGSLNADTGLLKWTFTSIDPSTGLPPSDPTVGFLPPDANGVEGQGAVVFSVMPKSAPTGTQITNKATVVFDANAPINTPTWLNTLDVNPPVSKVQALPATEMQATFPVSWSGTDVGSGIATYTIYVSDNGGTYTIWQSTVTTTSAYYTGLPGHTYAFYSIATDGAGNSEASKSAADTSTVMGGTPGGPALIVSKSHSGNFAPGEQGATYQVSVSNSAGAAPSNGPVMVTETLPTGLTLGSMAGTGWMCPSNICTRNDDLTGGASYPPITVTVNVAANAAASVTNTATVSGGGSLTSASYDVTTIAVEAAPFGSFDTPTNGQTGLAGDVNFGGWALSTIPVSVQIWRNPVPHEATQANGLVFVGNTTFVAGTRPDIASAYPAYPNSNAAGWGAQVLTNELPNSAGSGTIGNGIYTFHALAIDAAGLVTDLGGHMVTVNNAASVLPFGSIDTPAAGATISGTAYVNFGWALTPQPNSINTNGSTINVFIDSKPVGHPVYNNPRSDIETLFPGYANTNGAIGYFRINTTTLTNGLHQISWGVTDSAGHKNGIGSRYFIVQN